MRALCVVINAYRHTLVAAPSLLCMPVPHVQARRCSDMCMSIGIYNNIGTVWWSICYRYTASTFSNSLEIWLRESRPSRNFSTSFSKQPKPVAAVRCSTAFACARTCHSFGRPRIALCSWFWFPPSSLPRCVPRLSTTTRAIRVFHTLPCCLPHLKNFCRHSRAIMPEAGTRQSTLSSFHCQICFRCQR